ncbi:hypothetical protein [Tengunoibacter tsumagoiensis]|uniref:Uncharacterized protein n=1 Tax=Tengunoibacter tsumagoiensis TaxID=2014871 RepID=A0A402A3R4_9CHLR|nr:hypothetical protein [Tengunoibacter tsumagoiensis]GCE13689.1 hypothetical protein KTT_35480 [Tengunoibacter tsumagoiensis]
MPDATNQIRKKAAELVNYIRSDTNFKPKSQKTLKLLWLPLDCLRNL